MSTAVQVITHGAAWRPAQRAYFWVPMTTFVLFTLFPFYWMLVTSLKPNNEL